MNDLITIPIAVQGAVIGLVSAHPDDHIPHANLLYELQANHPTLLIHELVLTKGTDGINFRRDEPSFVASGQREAEGRASASHLGITSYTQLDRMDGELKGDEADIAKDIAAWAVEKDITTFVVLRTGDHTDHTAVADAARLAASSLGHATSVLELLPRSAQNMDNEGGALLIVDSSEDSLAIALGAALRNKSQFEVVEGARQGWISEGNYSLEPETHERFFQYPLTTAAHYQLLRFGS